MSDAVVPAMPADEVVNATASYRRAAQKALSATSAQNDLRAAQLAPVLFLERGAQFELVFDRIIHHLHQARAKASSELERAMIERVGEELFHQHLYLVVTQIENLRQRANRNLFQRIREFFSSASEATKAVPLGGPFVAAEIVPDAIRVLEAYFAKLVTDWTLQRDESAFYRQVARLLRKMADAEISTGRLTLLRNYYLGRKNLLLPLVIAHENVECAIALLRFDASDEERLRTLFLIIDSLAATNRFEEVKLASHAARGRYPQLYVRVRDYAVNRFRATVEQRHRETITIGGCAFNGALTLLVWSVMLAYVVSNPKSISKPWLATLGLVTAACAFPLAMAYASLFIAWKVRAFRKEL